ncbi:hypothetical protein A1O1_01737 [Capronia coronata CBS 617.96]|uniref:Uncharacterized protein n=1 Tax=Capronia coronata CBS 617.96 TaxID=1182541 RepID=W9YUL1_9EURO|nr:uncharacterized protein A1O1_01737 [Capronia coronata CBS 617.96]EXJ93345.1 hypothetical protein A1O1_01737 [Capronia coronata CBS 617.96]
MDRPVGETVVFNRSPLLQLLQGTLGKEVDFQALEALLISRLMRDSKFRYSPRMGFEIGIQQDHGRQWFACAPPDELERRVFPERFAGPEPASRQGLMPTKRAPYPWWVAQCLHYDLSCPLTRADAKARIGRCLLASTLKQSPRLSAVERGLRRSFQSQQSFQQRPSESNSTDEQGMADPSSGQRESDSRIEKDGGHLRDQGGSQEADGIAVQMPQLSSLAQAINRAMTPDPKDQTTGTVDNMTSMSSVSDLNEVDVQGSDKLLEQLGEDYIDDDAMDNDGPDSDVAAIPEVKITRSATARFQGMGRIMGKSRAAPTGSTIKPTASHKLSTGDRTVRRPKVQKCLPVSAPKRTQDRGAGAAVARIPLASSTKRPRTADRMASSTMLKEAAPLGDPARGGKNVTKAKCRPKTRTLTANENSTNAVESGLDIPRCARVRLPTRSEGQQTPVRKARFVTLDTDPDTPRAALKSTKAVEWSTAAAFAPPAFPTALKKPEESLAGRCTHLQREESKRKTTLTACLPPPDEGTCNYATQDATDSSSEIAAKQLHSSRRSDIVRGEAGTNDVLAEACDQEPCKRSHQQKHASPASASREPSDYAAKASKDSSLKPVDAGVPSGTSNKRSHARAFGGNQPATGRPRLKPDDQRQHQAQGSVTRPRNESATVKASPKVVYIPNYWENSRPHYPLLEHVMDRDGNLKRPPFTTSVSSTATLRNQIGDPFSQLPRPGRARSDAHHNTNRRGKGHDPGRKAAKPGAK